MLTPQDTSETRSRTYPLREDMPLQRTLWRLERLGWALWCLLLALALLGLFADGVLSHTRQHSRDGQLSVEYQRFARSSVTTRLVLQAQADAQGRIRLELGGHWRDRFDLLGIEPMPRLSRLSANAVQLEFDAEPEQQARIDLRLQPIQPGPVRSWIALSDGGQRLPLHQFIYP